MEALIDSSAVVTDVVTLVYRVKHFQSQEEDSLLHSYIVHNCAYV